MHFKTAVVILLMTFCGRVAVAQNCDVPPYAHEQKVLGNGLHLIAVRTPGPNRVTLEITIHTREALPGNSALPHVLELMVRRDRADDVARRANILRTAGARESSSTSDDRTTFHTVFAKDDLADVIRVEADRFLRAQISEADYRDVLSSAQDEYRHAIENPVFKLFERQREKAFSAHPYRYGTFGNRQDIAKLPDQYSAAKSFFDRWYKPEHTTVTLVGDVDPHAAIDLLEQNFNSWPRGSAKTSDVPAEPPQKTRVVEHVWWKTNTPAWVTVAFHSPAYSDDSRDFAAMDLLLEAWFGRGSDLYRRLVVDEEKVDLLGIDLPPAVDPHLATIYARVRNTKDLTYVRDLILATAARAKRETLPAQLLAGAKTNLQNSLLRDLRSADGTMAALGPRMQFADPYASLARYACKRASLTERDLHEVADRYFIDQQLVVTTLSHALRQLALPQPPTLDAAMMNAPPAATTPGADLDVTVVKTASPMLELKLVFAAGSGRDPIGKEGLAALSAAMIANGHPASQSAVASSDALYAAGISVSGQLEKESATFNFTAHRDAWREILDVALPLVLDPALDRADFLTLRTRQQQSIDRFLVDETAFSRELLQRRVFFAGPYGHPAVGSDDGLATSTLRDVHAFIDAYYRTGNLTVGVSGDVPDEFIVALRQRLAGLRSGTSPAGPIKPSVPLGIAVDVFEDPGVEKSTAALGFGLDVTRSQEDFAPLAVAALVFGDPQSDESRLYERIVHTRGVASTVGARIEQTPSIMQRINDPLVRRRASLFEVNLGGVDPKNLNMTLRLVVFQLRRLIKDGVSDAEFTRARDVLIKEIELVEGDSSRALGDELDARWYGGTRWVDLRAALQRLTVADVNRAIREHLQAANLFVAVVAKDGREQRLQLRKSSPSFTYRETQPKKVLDEDAALAAMPFDLEAEDVRFFTMEDLQEQGW